MDTKEVLGVLTKDDSELQKMVEDKSARTKLASVLARTRALGGLGQKELAKKVGKGLTEKERT